MGIAAYIGLVLLLTISGFALFGTLYYLVERKYGRPRAQLFLLGLLCMLITTLIVLIILITEP